MPTTRIRMADGDFYLVTDGPHCHAGCNGIDGFSRDPNPEDRVPVPCPVHRPHLATRKIRRNARTR